MSFKTSTSQAAVGKSKGIGWKLPRPIFVLAAVVLLVTLPVLPLSFLGIPGPDNETSAISQIGRLISGQLNVKKIQSHGKFGLSRESVCTTESMPRQTVENHEPKILALAVSSLKEEIARHPDDPANYNQIGLIYLKLLETELARESFQQAIHTARIELARLKDKASVLESQGKLDEASKVLLESSSIHTELSAAHGNLAQVFERLGMQQNVLAELDQMHLDGLLAGKDSESAKKDDATSQSQRLNSNTAKVIARGQAFMQSGQLNQAVKEFGKAIAAEPNLAIGHQQLAIVSQLTGNHKQAIASLSKICQLEPKNAQTHNDIGKIYLEMGLPDQAQEEFQKALEINPKLLDSAINLGNLYCRQEKYQEATQIYRNAIIHNQNSAIAHNHLATTLSMQDNYEDAIEEFRKAIALDPKLSSAHYGLGLSLYNTMNYLPAIAAFKQALLLNPQLTEASAKIEQAYRKSHQKRIAMQR